VAGNHLADAGWDVLVLEANDEVGGAVRSAELNLSAKRLNIAVARADYFPTLTAFFQSGYQAFPGPGQGVPTSGGVLREDLCAPGSPAGRLCQNGGFFSDRQAGLNISFPLFDGLRVKSNVDLAKAQVRLAELQLQQQREAVSLDVARARAELRRARAVFAASQQNSAEADEAFRLASLRFARGLSTQLEVSDAQLALLTAQSTEARATYDLFLASADLARALGVPGARLINDLEATAYGGVLALRAVALVLAGALYAAAVDPDEVLRLFRRVSFRSALTAALATRMVPVLARDAYSPYER